MLIYLSLLGLSALFALAPPKSQIGLGLGLSFLAFGLIYTLVAGLRFEIGGDWFSYQAMFDYIRTTNLREGLEVTDPAFAILLSVSSGLGTGIYLANGFCAAILFFGVVRAARQTREPWLAITVAVPYLLIVVGMGYVRQAAAIGLILAATDAVRRDRVGMTLLFLLLSFSFHSPAVVAWPLFALALANRNKLRIFLLASLGSTVMLALFSTALTEFSAGYIGDRYESGGALIRLLMGLVPSIILLVNYRRFDVGGRARSVWIGFALANLAAAVAFQLSPSSTAVDRIALYFTGVQLVTFGSIGQLMGFSRRSGVILRLLVILYALAVLLIWLLYATHASSWTPYKSILTFL